MSALQADGEAQRLLNNDALMASRANFDRQIHELRAAQEEEMQSLRRRAAEREAQAGMMHSQKYPLQSLCIVTLPGH